MGSSTIAHWAGSIECDSRFTMCLRIGAAARCRRVCPQSRA
jgi:hypothetical protein